jgi:DNA-binding NarL/FixJ family response regulator/tRNA A-37 threonylcarbamoyl transferase component Bud32
VVRVLVVDDFQRWRDSVRSDLARDPTIVVVGEAGDGAEAVDRARETLPDVVLMDLNMPVMNGIQATKAIRRDDPRTQILMVSAFDEQKDVIEAVKAGAIGYVLKSADTDFVEAVHRVRRGEVLFTPILARDVLAAVRAGPTPEKKEPVLTDREQEILTLFGRAYSYQRIAERFGLSEGVVRNEVHRILARLQRQYTASALAEPAPRAVLTMESAGAPTTRRHSGEPPPLPKDWSGGGRFWLIMAAIVIAVAAILAVAAPTGDALRRFDLTFRRRFGDPQGSLTAPMKAVRVLASVWTLRAIRLATILILVAYRRLRHLLIFLGSALVVGALVRVLPVTPRIPGSVGLGGFVHPSVATASLAVTLVGSAYALAPTGRWRRAALIGTASVVLALTTARLYLHSDYLTQAIVGVVLGVAIPLIAFRVFAPEASFPVSYRRGRAAHLDIGKRRMEAIRRAVRDQLGLTVLEVTRFGLAGSGGSTPLRIRVTGEPELEVFGKLYATNHMRSDRWYKLGRMIVYGALEDEKPFNSVRRLVEYEDYMLRYIRDAGVLSAEPFGFAEISPEREYLLLTEFLEGASEIGDATVVMNARLTRDTLHIVRDLWNAGLAHRDIKPANVLVQGGRPVLIDVAFSEIRPSPWRQAVDLANMMLVLAIRSTPEDVYEAALQLFRQEDVAEAFAATRGVTMPSQLRTMVRQDGRDLVEAFRRLAPERAPIAIQRWSVRRLLLTAGVGAGLALTVLVIVANVGTGLL